MSTQPVPSPQSWYDYAQQLPEGLPDQAYDIQRSKYFDQVVRPWALSQGHSPEVARQEFMEKTPRAGKSSYPRVDLVAKTAAKALIDPLAGAAGMRDVQSYLDQEVAKSEQEATQQGINPTPYKLVGALGGQLPYWYAGLEGAGLAARAVAPLAGGASELDSIRRLFNVAAGGAIEGTYAAAKAQEGHRMSEGAKGAAEGMAGMVPFEFAKPLWKVLRGTHDLSEEAAKAVEEVAKGTASDSQVAAAAKVVEEKPEIVATVQKVVEEKVAVGKKSGRPSGVVAEPTAKQVQVDVQVAGQPQPMSVAVAPEEIGQTAELLGQALDRGGSIENITGDPEASNGLLREVDSSRVSAGSYDVELELRGEKGEKPIVISPQAVEEVAPTKLAEPTAESAPEVLPANPLINSLKEVLLNPKLSNAQKSASRLRLQRLSPETLLQVDEQLANPLEAQREIASSPTPAGPLEGVGEEDVSAQLAKAQELSRAKAAGEGVGQPVGARLGLEDVSEFDQLEQLKSGKVRDKLSGRVYANADQALKAKGLQAPEKFVGAAEELTQGMDQAGQPTTVTERPLATRVTGQLEGVLPPEASAGTIAWQGEKSTIYYRNPNPTNMFHENLHARFGYLGMTGLVDNIVRTHPTGAGMSEAFDTSLKELYGESWPEEAYVYSASAIRTNNERVLQPFIDADTDKPTVLRWVAENTEELLRGVAARADSLPQRTAQRQLREVLRRSTGELQTIARDTVDLVGDELRVKGGKYVVSDRNMVDHVFDSRDDLVAFLEKNYNEPLSTPNLVDDSSLHPDIPRAVDQRSHSLGRAPLSGDPLSEGVGEGMKFSAEELEAELSKLKEENASLKAGRPAEPPTPGSPEFGAPEGRQVRAGFQGLSYWTRPFYAWLDTVAKKNGWPELYNTMKELDFAKVREENFKEPFAKVLGDIFRGVKEPRRSDFYHYLEAATEDKDSVAEQLHITDAEIGKLNRLRDEFYDPLASEFNIKAEDYIQDYAPRLRNSNLDINSVGPTTRLTKDSMDFFAQHSRTGELDPRETDLLKVSDAYLRLGARKKFMADPIEKAAKLNNLKTPDGDFITGGINSLLKRHIESFKGVPDETGKTIDRAAGVVAESINDIIDKINPKLPERLQLEHWNEAPRDAMNKWIQLSYVGGLALRPMVPIRDWLTTFITGYPILGGKYLGVGAREAVKVGAYDEAMQAGALLRTNYLKSVYSSGEEGATGALSKFSENAMKPMQWSNNVSRLVSFFGHKERAADAIEAFRTAGSQDIKQLMRESAMTWLDEQMQKNFVKEITGGAEVADVSKRIAKELTEIAHWNYRQGATPGIYRYTLGRLFGQYGTWPLNYIEYARRLVANPDKQESLKALSRLAIAHYSILAAGQSVGIDTAQWVFTQPMAYGGGPLMQAVVSLPGAVGDWESYRGAEARRNVVRPFFPDLLPGGEALHTIHTAIANDDPDIWKRILGFTPLKAADENKFWHQIVP